MSDPTSVPTKNAFSFDVVEREFGQELTTVLARSVDGVRAKFLVPENIISYTHGRTWVAVEGSESEFTQESHELSTPLHELAAHNLHVLNQFFDEILLHVEVSLLQMIAKTVGEATQRTGNIIDAKAHSSLAEAFIAGLEKMSFGLDKEGKLSLPSTLLDPDLQRKLLASLEAGGESVKERIEEIKKRKLDEALARERARKARFSEQL